MTWPGILILSLFGAVLAALVYCFPIILAAVGVIVLLTVIWTMCDGRRLAALAADRQGESICSFARSFDYRAVDTWVIRAVFEELQPFCGFGHRVLPLRATDDLRDLLCVDPEDFYGRVKTAADLVLFLVNQPSRSAA
jgi:hypothetical protein